MQIFLQPQAKLLVDMLGPPLAGFYIVNNEQSKEKKSRL